jgi:hypothetical protein
MPYDATSSSNPARDRRAGLLAVFAVLGAVSLAWLARLLLRTEPDGGPPPPSVASLRTPGPEPQAAASPPPQPSTPPPPSPLAGTAAVREDAPGDAWCREHNAGAGCTPTEALFARHDPTGHCYACLVASGCLDDAENETDVDHECQDLTGIDGARGGPAAEKACLATIECVLASGCADERGAGKCYCGSARGTRCLEPRAPDGPCRDVIRAGFGGGDEIAVNRAFASHSMPAGMASTIFACGAANGCTTCLGPRKASP